MAIGMSWLTRMGLRLSERTAESQRAPERARQHGAVRADLRDHCDTARRAVAAAAPVRFGYGRAVLRPKPAAAPTAVRAPIAVRCHAKSERPESGVTLALWFARLAESLELAPVALSPFRRELPPGTPLAPEALRSSFGVPAGLPLAVRSADEFFAGRGTAPGRRDVRKAMDEHLDEVRLIEVGSAAAACHKLLVGGRAPDGSFAGFSVRLDS